MLPQVRILRMLRLLRLIRLMLLRASAPKPPRAQEALQEPLAHRGRLPGVSQHPLLGVADVLRADSDRSEVIMLLAVVIYVFAIFLRYTLNCIEQFGEWAAPRV